MDILTNIVSISAIVGLLLTVAAKFLPNEKVYQMGVGVGQFLNSFGHSKIGESWESVEDFFINSLGQFFSGVRVGLDLDENADKASDSEPKKDDKPKENANNVRK